jgi:hypothetical protein
MLRTDIWVGAFVRRHNDRGTVCVLARRGDPIAGQVFIEIDHLDGTASLFVPAPLAMRKDDGVDRVFQRRFARVPAMEVRERLRREADFDPDFWQVCLELRGEDAGITVVS